MNDRTIIRRLILAQWAFWIAGALVNEFYLRSLPDPLRRLVDVDLFTNWNPAIAWPLALVAVVTVLFSYVSLYRLRPGSGRLFLWVNGIGTLLGPLMPPTHESGLAYTLGALGMTCFGMTVAWIVLGRVPYVDGVRVETPANAQHA